MRSSTGNTANARNGSNAGCSQASRTYAILVEFRSLLQAEGGYIQGASSLDDRILDKEASRLGVTRQSIIKDWLAERLERLAYDK